jgi:hypothetical protein
MKGRKQPSSNRSPKRKLEIIRGMMRQILVGLKACHNTGAPTGIVLHCAETAVVHLRPPYCNQQHEKEACMRKTSSHSSSADAGIGAY